jgi:hypothetical protein
LIGSSYIQITTTAHLVPRSTKDETFLNTHQRMIVSTLMLNDNVCKIAGLSLQILSTSPLSLDSVLKSISLVSGGSSYLKITLCNLLVNVRITTYAIKLALKFQPHSEDNEEFCRSCNSVHCKYKFLNISNKRKMDVLLQSRKND